MPNLRNATALALLLALLLALTATSASASDCRATRAAYGALKHGMSYRRAVTILGCPGRAVTRMTIGESRRETYAWRGTGTYGANLTASFRNGHLTSKSQLGLK